MIFNNHLSPSKSARSFDISQASPCLEQPVFTFETQYHENKQDQSQFMGIHKDEDTQHSQCRQHIQKQYKMRIQSIVKGYQVKISRQNQTFQLKEMKYMQQIEYLKRQIKQLTSINKQSKTQVDHYCNLCSNGDVIKFMKNMLDAVQSDHQNCLSQKSELNNKILTLEQKVNILKIENEESQERYTKLKQQIKQVKSEKENWQREKRQKERQFRDIQRNYQVKQLAFQQQVAKHVIMQKELEGQIKKIQLQHIQAISKMKEDNPKQTSLKKDQTNESRKSLYPEVAKSLNYEKTQQKDLYPRDRFVPSFGRDNNYTSSKGNSFGLKYDYLSQKKNGGYNSSYENLKDLSINQKNLFYKKSPLILRSSCQNNYDVKASGVLQTWKNQAGKAQQSYSDYVSNKKKIKKNEITLGPQTNDSFETFRPSKSYL